jgi:hypothetical protein
MATRSGWDLHFKLSIWYYISCGTIALYGPFFSFLFFWRTIGLRISPYQKFAKLRPWFCRTFQQWFWQQNALWERSHVGPPKKKKRKKRTIKSYGSAANVIPDWQFKVYTMLSDISAASPLSSKYRLWIVVHSKPNLEDHKIYAFYSQVVSNTKVSPGLATDVAFRTNANTTYFVYHLLDIPN